MSNLETLLDAIKQWFLNHFWGDKLELVPAEEDEVENLHILKNEEFENFEKVKADMGYYT